jgi:hypothetical protein
MSHKQLLLIMHEKALWESRNVYKRDRDRDFGWERREVYIKFNIRWEDNVI